MKTSAPTLRELLEGGARRLRGALGGARENPRREASLLLQAALGIDRARFLTEGEALVAAADAARYWEMVGERARGVPLQLLVGRTGFHGVELRVEAGVFIPRPETELLVDEACCEVAAILSGADRGGAHGPRSGGSGGEVCVLDLGTGSGAVAVAIGAFFRERGGVRVFAGDWSPQAVRLARRNVEENGLSECVEVQRSQLFSAFAALEGRVDVLVSNPPYVNRAERERLPPEVLLGDPEEALFDPQGGTGFHRRIAARGRAFLRPGGLLALEIGEGQGGEVAAILAEHGYEEVRVLADLTGRDRLVRGRRGSSTRSS